jgi:hypothetical protein
MTIIKHSIYGDKEIVDFGLGTIDYHAKLAANRATQSKQVFQFRFNDLDINVGPGSQWQDLVEKYWLQKEIQNLKLGRI